MITSAHCVSWSEKTCLSVLSVYKVVAENACLILPKDQVKVILTKVNLNAQFAIRLQSWINQTKFWLMFSKISDSYVQTLAKKLSHTKRFAHIRHKENAIKATKDLLIHQEANKLNRCSNQWFHLNQLPLSNHQLNRWCPNHRHLDSVVDIVIADPQSNNATCFRKIPRLFTRVTSWIRQQKWQGWKTKHHSLTTFSASMEQRVNSIWLVVVTTKKMKTLFIQCMRSRQTMTSLSSKETQWSTQDMVIRHAGSETSSSLFQDPERRRTNLR